MSSFSSIYKKAFKELLYPYGYKSWRRFFYKETGDVCIFIQAKKTAHLPDLNMEIDIIPFCTDLVSEEYDPNEGYELVTFYRLLVPDIFKSNQLAYDFLIKRLDASNDEKTQICFDNICNDMNELILPYIHRFTDLNYCYDGLINICKSLSHKNCDGGKIEVCLKDERIFGLSLKLHKYENALVYVDTRLMWHSELFENRNKKQIELRKGNLFVMYPENWGLDECEKMAKSDLRRNPNLIKDFLESGEEMIAESKKEIERFQVIKDALLSKDTAFLDNLVAETEEKSREYIWQMIHGKKSNND